jgi:hypothetical protein
VKLIELKTNGPLCKDIIYHNNGFNFICDFFSPFDVWIGFPRHGIVEGKE